jgi:hypothetical protein
MGMMKINVFLLITIIAAQLSCKKTATSGATDEKVIDEKVIVKKVIDTVKPLPYLPAFPGSYWKYSDGSTVTTSPNYVKDASRYRSDTLVTVSDTFYVPLYGSIHLWGYRFRQEICMDWRCSDTSPFVTVISESSPKGSQWITGRNRFDIYCNRIMAKDTSINIEGKEYYPTIVIGEFFCPQSSTACYPTARKYYTKDIGLAKIESIAWATGEVARETHIVDYFINK